MKNKIDKILEELYLIDSSLKENKEDLEIIVKELLLSVPNIKFDENFKQELYKKLKHRIKEIKVIDNSYQHIGKISFWHKMSYSVLGAVVCLLVIIPIYHYGGLVSRNNKLALREELSYDKFSENKMLSKKAFGSIDEMLRAENQDLSSDLAGYGGARSTALMNITVENGTREIGIPMSEDGLIEPDLISSKMPSMIAPEIDPYNYEYVGDEIILPSNNILVQRRIMGKNETVDNSVTGIDLVDLSKFSKLKFQQINLIQDEDEGYNIGINYDNESININKLYKTDRFYEVRSEVLTAKDMLPENQLISISNNFLKKYNINIDNYGKPVIDKFWKNMSSDRLISNIINVTYPLMINDYEVYERDSLVGVRIGVNIVNRSVENLYNLNSNIYESSEYELETDIDNILNKALKGGLWPAYNYSGQDEMLKLGTPKIVYSLVRKFDNNINNEYYIPSLIFPIEESSVSNMPYQKNIIVPLTKDFDVE